MDVRQNSGCRPCPLGRSRVACQWASTASPHWQKFLVETRGPTVLVGRAQCHLVSYVVANKKDFKKSEHYYDKSSPSLSPRLVTNPKSMTVE